MKGVDPKGVKRAAEVETLARISVGSRVRFYAEAIQLVGILDRWDFDGVHGQAVVRTPGGSRKFRRRGGMGLYRWTGRGALSLAGNFSVELAEEEES